MNIQINLDIFSDQILLESSDYLLSLRWQCDYINQGDNAKSFNVQKYYLPKSIIKNYYVIINGKNFYDQAIISDIKGYEEIRKLTLRPGEDYTTSAYSRNFVQHSILARRGTFLLTGHQKVHSLTPPPLPPLFNPLSKCFASK